MIKPLGQMLIDGGHIDSDRVEEAAAAAARESIRIGDYLIAQCGCDEKAVYTVLADQFRLPFIAHIENVVKEELVKDISPELFSTGRCFPVDQSDTLLHLVVSDPLDLDIQAQATMLTDLPTFVSVTTPSQMKQVHARLFEGGGSLKRMAGRISKEYQVSAAVDDTSMSLEEIKKRTESKPIVRLVSAIFDEAIRLRASDVHIEAGAYDAVVRFRIDGMLTPHMDLERSMYQPLISRIKILADLDIAEKRVPQDGRVRYTYLGNEFDFRVSTLPTHHGEKVVTRILKHDQSLLDIKNLGVPEPELSRLSELIEKPQGMLFVTGPTGSGKSSTLFACLNKIRTKAINITTIENPIEYKLDGINQVQINEKAGVTFAATLRSILRQDPDVILIGEIRDTETAEIAIQASQTGHLVFSTLHTNDAISALTRLKDLGIPGFLVASSIIGIQAQRLVRVLCPHCKAPAEPSEDLKGRWKVLLGDTPIPPAHEARGCEHCNNLGYRGRTGVFEVIAINEHVRSLIAENASENQIRKACRDAGMRPLIQNGIEKIRNGETTIEELLRVVLIEDIGSFSGAVT